MKGVSVLCHRLSQSSLRFIVLPNTLNDQQIDIFILTYLFKTCNLKGLSILNDQSNDLGLPRFRRGVNS